jgi:hypothetical protein
VEQDPSPSAPGIFLGSGATPAACLGQQQNDLDGDGVGDYCEIWLATGFAPELYYAHTDDVRGEPRWAIRKVSVEPASVEIAYLLSYYLDRGSHELLCQTTLPPPIYPHPCAGHYGDSEAILLFVEYDYASQHWVLKRARLSQHGNLNSFGAGPKGYPAQFVYPGQRGGYPRVFVAVGKHANYASDWACDNGAHLDYDECNSDTTARVAVTANGDVGSSMYHRLDCVLSANPLYSMNPPECYWTGARFGGWQSGAQPSADPYGPLLTANGF